MSETIERTAKAIYERWAEARGCPVPWGEVAALKHSFGELARAEARAAIESIREPIGLTCMHGITMSERPSQTCVCHTAFSVLIDSALTPPAPVDGVE